MLSHGHLRAGADSLGMRGNGALASAARSAARRAAGAPGFPQSRTASTSDRPRCAPRSAGNPGLRCSPRATRLARGKHDPRLEPSMRRTCLGKARVTPTISHSPIPSTRLPGADSSPVASASASSPLRPRIPDFWFRRRAAVRGHRRASPSAPRQRPGGSAALTIASSPNQSSGRRRLTDESGRGIRVSGPKPDLAAGHRAPDSRVCSSGGSACDQNQAGRRDP